MKSDDEPDATQSRLLTAKAAAAYLGVSWTTFNNWVNRGLLPVALPFMKRWDRKAIDAAIDRMRGIEDEYRQVNSLEEWRRERDAKKAKSLDADHFSSVALSADSRRQPYARAKGDHGPNRNWHLKDWEDHVRDRALGARELAVLEALYAQKPNIMSPLRIKGAGPSTMDRLVARGFAKAHTPPGDPIRMPDYSITTAGEAAWLANIQPC